MNNNRNILKKVILACCIISSASMLAQTALVKTGSNNQLLYTPDANGFIIPDFSYAGYHNGDLDIPDVSVVKEIQPVSGDNTTHIQNAINEVANRTPDSNGFRGALLLKAGKYEINGTIRINKDGVVLKGVGNGESPANSTIIFAKGNSPAQRDVIVLGASSSNKWTTKVSNTQQNITDNTVPVGAMSFTVASATPYQVGDQIAIYHPCSEKWLQAINYGGVPADYYWESNQYPVIFHRYITAIAGNTISIDAPVFYTLNKSLSQSYIYKIGGTATIKESGIENLRVDIESKGGEDEAHAWQVIRFRTAENCWAKNVVTKGFGQSGFITESCTRTTIEDCQAIDPISQITGERRYNFNTYHNSQLILFKNCYAREGRHNYVSNGTSTVSGIVFLSCISEAVHNTNEGHRHWTQGMLFDGHKEIDLSNRSNRFVLGLFNRTTSGSGHGWSAVQSVLWNCDVTNKGIIGLQKPPTSQNYAIGCVAEKITGTPISSSNFTVGYVESHNKKITAIPSLYIAQLNARKSLVTGNAATGLNAEINIWKNNKTVFIQAENLEQINVYNLKGTLLKTENTTQSIINITLPEGFYILQVKTTENEYIKKIIL